MASYGNKITSILARTDRVLAGLEDRVVQEIQASLELAFVRLERQLRARWENYSAESKPGLLATQRSLLLLDQLQSSLSAFGPEIGNQYQARFQALLQSATQSGESLAEELIRLSSGNSDEKIANANVPIEAIASQANQAATALAKHSQEFIGRASALVQQGMIQGWGAAKMAKELASELGILKYKAERIVRTESMRSFDNANRARYQANDVKMVLRVATLDNRVCGYCAERAGNIYKLEEAPGVIHPNDRCTNVPVKKSWIDAGLIDLNWAEKHHQDSLARTEDDPKKTATNFENGKAPKPVWMPGKGEVNGGFVADRRTR